MGEASPWDKDLLCTRVLLVGHLGHTLSASLPDVSRQPRPHKPFAEQVRDGTGPWVEHLLSEVLWDQRLPHLCGDITLRGMSLPLDCYQVMLLIANCI